MDNEMMKDLQARMRACTTREEAEEIMVEVAAVAPPLPIDQIEIFTAVADAAADYVLGELLATAEYLETEWIPVDALKLMLLEPYTYTRNILATIDKYGFEVDAGVPDDISELDGM